MSSTLVQRLANKIAHEHFTDEKLKQQKDRLEEFYYDTTGALKNIVNELAGDLFILKEKGFNPELRQLLIKIYQQIIDLYKDIDPRDPYPGTLNLINWANAKQNKAILENLEFLIENHLKKHEVSFYGKDNLKQPKVFSISKFCQLIPKLKKYIQDNPMLMDIYQSEAELDKIEQLDHGPTSSPEDPTKLL
jgi:hypothetical protein